VWPARTRYVLNGRLQTSGYRYQELQRVVPLLRTTPLMFYGSALVVCAVIRDSHYSRIMRCANKAQRVQARRAGTPSDA
jgi:hypothetical protein